MLRKGGKRGSPTVLIVLAFIAGAVLFRPPTQTDAVNFVAPQVLSLQTAQAGSLLVQALDYRPVVQAVYSANNFSVCVPASADKPQCWLQLSVKVQCQELFKEYLRLLQHHQPKYPPPKEIRSEDKAVFLLNGYTQFKEMYVQQQDYAPDAEVPVWHKTMLSGWIEKVKARQPVGHYGEDSVSIYQALDCHPVKGSAGVVFGTEAPWLEAILFAYGECSCRFCAPSVSRSGRVT